MNSLALTDTLSSILRHGYRERELGPSALQTPATEFTRILQTDRACVRRLGPETNRTSMAAASHKLYSLGQPSSSFYAKQHSENSPTYTRSRLSISNRSSFLLNWLSAYMRSSSYQMHSCGDSFPATYPGWNHVWGCKW